MHWETPSYDEIRMDAEIGSYQEDTDAARVRSEKTKRRDARAESKDSIVAPV